MDTVIESQLVPNWTRTTTAPKLRIYYSETFTDSDGNIIQGGDPDESVAYDVITTTLVGGDVTIPSFIIPSTQDGLDNRLSTVSFYWYNGNSPIGPFGPYVNLAVPVDLADRTFSGLKIFNEGSPALPRDDFYTKRDINSLLNTVAGAPLNAYYFTATGDLSLPNEVNLGALSDGILKITVVSGVATPSIATPGTDYLNSSSNLNASNLLTGTIPDGRFPSTLPAVNGSLLTNLNASNLASGSVPLARLNLLSGVYEPANSNIQAHIASISNPHSVTKAQVGLGTVENTALSTWTGSINLTTLGTIGTGSWQGTAIGDTWISSAATWNAKQNAGNYITALTGDIAASGPGSAAATLATVNGNVGTFTNATVTVNAKGLITSASSGGASFADPMTTRGDIIVRGSGGTTRLGLGAANRYLGSDGTDVVYSQISLTTGVTGTLPVGNGGTGAATFTVNGVLYGNTASALQVTAQGAANSVLTANAGAPVFSATPTVDRLIVNPATATFDLSSSTLAVGSLFGNGNTASPTTINVASGKQLSGWFVTAINSGAGKMRAFEFQLEATGAVQDSGQEPIRGLIGRVTNSGTGNAKTSAIRVGSTGSGSNASLLVGVDADVTVVAGTNTSSTVYASTVVGTTDDVASHFLFEAGNNARILQGIGSTGPIKFGAVAFRAYMATGSSVNARGFQQLNNSGTEIFYTDLSGNLFATSLSSGTNPASTGATRIPNNVFTAARNAANSGDVNILKVNASDIIEFGANMMNNNANPGYIFGTAATGFTLQRVDSGPERFRILKNDVGEFFTITALGNVKIGGTAVRGTTEGSNQLDIFNGTAPVGSLSNGVSFYSSAGEARVMDSGGNSTLLSPHDRITNEWIFHSKNTFTGRTLRIDMERMMKFLNGYFGTDFIHEYVESPQLH